MPLFKRTDLAVFDSFQRGSPHTYNPDTPVRMIASDSEAQEKFGQWPWPRPVMAELVTRLRLARQEEEGGVGGRSTGQPDHRLGAQMDAVTVAYRGAGAAILVFDELIIPDDPHGARGSAPPRHVQALRAGGQGRFPSGPDQSAGTAVGKSQLPSMIDASGRYRRTV